MAPPILCVVGRPGAGKTTLILRLLPELRALGMSVGTVRRGDLPLDRERTDEDRLRLAGAETVVLSSPGQVAVVKAVNDELWLDELAREFFDDRHLILAEGYFRSAHPKIEVHRSAVHGLPLCDRRNAKEKRLLAMVCDVKPDTDLPCFGLDEARAVAAFIARHHLGWVHSGLWAD